jgi:hypothetical protein
VTSKRRFEHAYAVVRVDLFQGDDVEWNNRVTVKSIEWTREAAEREAERLNRVNNGKQCVYFAQTTRVAPRKLTEDSA